MQLPILCTHTSRGHHFHQLQLHRALWALTLGNPESDNPEFTASLYQLLPSDVRHIIYLSNPSFLTCKMGTRLAFSPRMAVRVEEGSRACKGNSSVTSGIIFRA